jgi:Tol biopolymer transport system component
VFYASPAGDRPLLERMSLADGRTSRFATPGAASAPVWSAATHRLAYIEPVENASLGTNVLRFMNERGEELFPEFPRQRASINNGFLAWSADGRQVAAVAVIGNASATIWIAEPEGKEPLRKLIDLPLSVRPRGITWTADGSGVIVAFQDSSSDIVMFDLRLP